LLHHLLGIVHAANDPQSQPVNVPLVFGHQGLERLEVAFQGAVDQGAVVVRGLIHGPNAEPAHQGVRAFANRMGRILPATGPAREGSRQHKAATGGRANAKPRPVVAPTQSRDRWSRQHKAATGGRANTKPRPVVAPTRSEETNVYGPVVSIMARKLLMAGWLRILAPKKGPNNLGCCVDILRITVRLTVIPIMIGRWFPGGVYFHHCLGCVWTCRFRAPPSLPLGRQPSIEASVSIA